MTSRFFPVLALIIAFGTFFAYVYPTWSGSIAETRAAITSDADTLAAAGEYTANQAALASARNDIDPANLERLEAFLPDSVDNVGLILDLNALATRSGLSLSNIDVKSSAAGASGASVNVSGALPVEARGPVGSIDLSLSAVGTYAALQSFLGGIEKSGRLLDVQDILVKGSETGVYTYQITMRLYWLR